MYLFYPPILYLSIYISVCLIHVSTTMRICTHTHTLSSYLSVYVTISKSILYLSFFLSIYLRTHTHTHTQMGYLDVSPGVRMRHLEGPKNPDGLNLGIHIFVYVNKVHICINMLRGGMRSWTNCFFLLTCLFF